MDLKRKLSSRKFWLALIAFGGSIMAFFNVGDDTIAQVASIIMAGGSLIAYIIAEGFVDASNKTLPMVEVEQIIDVDKESKD